MAKIDEEKIQKVHKFIGELLDGHMNEIDSAFRESDDGKLKVAIPVTFRVGKKGLEANVGISFTTKKVSETFDLPLEQTALFEEPDAGK